MVESWKEISCHGLKRHGPERAHPDVGLELGQQYYAGGQGPDPSLWR